ncbi:LAGLIDADG family homing endonuclease [Kribbella shirazensis]|uniref:Homing endonuclease LAGLIDADG domain-containing protein n=1 Tax=Kribbella shirazensis TaxID=1105143 RepID=A0A7X5VGE8_9ACTN|nr:LAGLIDADG family homing endonuclease [Kribbella shirazensis]NIK60774.1 hypothetical protein [Kribbella shirazensis]
MSRGEAGLAWLAGLLEGEGYFGTINSHVAGKIYRYPRVGVTMTDRDVVERVADMFGLKVTSIRPKPPSKLMQYRFTLTGARAAQLMVDLRPMLGVRRQSQIDAVLAEYSMAEDTAVRRARSNREAALRRYGHAEQAPPADDPQISAIAQQAQDHHQALCVSESTGRFHKDQRDRLIKALRAEDPQRWTYPALAAAIGCSPASIAAAVRGRVS